jgi:hypothetical protein
VICAAIGVYVSARHPALITYTQLTDFTDSASGPALSPDGHILAFIRGDSYFMKQDGSGHAKVFPYPVMEIQGISPGRKWLMAIVAYPEGNSVLPSVMAIPLDGGKPRHIAAEPLSRLTAVKTITRSLCLFH